MVDEPNLPEQVRDLITDHLAADGGGIVTGYCLTVEYVDSDGDDAWMQVVAPDQRLSRTMGLIEFAAGVAHYEQQRYLEEVEGGDQ